MADCSTYIFPAPVFWSLSYATTITIPGEPQKCPPVALVTFVLIGLHVFLPVYEAYSSNRVGLQRNPCCELSQRKKRIHPTSTPTLHPPASRITKSLCTGLLGCNDTARPPCVPDVHLHAHASNTCSSSTFSFKSVHLESKIRHW